MPSEKRHMPYSAPVLSFCIMDSPPCVMQYSEAGLAVRACVAVWAQPASRRNVVRENRGFNMSNPLEKVLQEQMYCEQILMAAHRS